MRRVKAGGVLVLFLPAPLVLSMIAVFALFTRWFGEEAGYVLAFLAYWLVWCLVVPVLLLGTDGARSLLRPAHPLFIRENRAAAVLWTLVLLGALVTYLPGMLQAPLLLLAIAVPVATLNGFREELLWRGLYLRTFLGSPIAAWVLPAIPFALWHFVPQMVYPAATGAGSLVVASLFLGLAYGYISWRTKSVWWASISHGLSGVIAAGGSIAPSIHHLVTG